MKLNRYENWLMEWNQLRNDNLDNSLEQALQNINDWWQFLPMDLHYLHWDDVKNWPDPWDLLADGIFCPVAKSLGIVYTLHYLNRSDINDLQLIKTVDDDNLVQVNRGKYILNWAPGELLNTRTSKIQIAQTMDTSVITKNLN